MNGPMISVRGVVCEGHGVASGVRGDVPGGTIRPQMPLFKERGLDLSHCFAGTLNVSVAPHLFALKKPRHVFRGVRWSPDSPAEDFSLTPCVITLEDRSVDGYVYYPHPETKPGHFQPPHVMEIIAPFLDGITYGSVVVIGVDPEEVHIQEGTAH